MRLHHQLFRISLAARFKAIAQFARSFKVPDRSFRHVVGQPANRLKKVQVKVEEPLPDFSKMSLAQLENEPITFGTAHKGKSYQEVWNTDHSALYGESRKWSHRQFLHYVEMMIERAELTQEGALVTEPKKNAPAWQVGRRPSRTTFPASSTWWSSKPSQRVPASDISRRGC